MSITKNRSAASQLTGSGTSTALDTSTSYRHSLYCRHYNGSGSVTTAATFRVQVKPSGGTYIDLGTFQSSRTTGGYDYFVITLPDDCVSVQCIYTAPTGPTGFTLDYEVGVITAL